MQRQGSISTWVRGHPRVFDAGVVLVLLLVTVPPMWIDFPIEGFTPREPDLLGVVLAVSSVLPVLWRCRYPIWALLAITGPSIALTMLGYTASTGIPAFVLIYSAAAYHSKTRGLVALVLGAASVGSYVLFAPYPSMWVDALAVTAISVAAYAFGRSMGFRRAYVAELELRTDRLEHARDADTRAALAEERGRIARELHDVVAHHVSVMTVQASGAQRTLDRNPQCAREALVAIETTGRQALIEMRRIVGVLRTGDAPEQGALTPQPGLDNLDALVGQVREAGLDVEVVTDGEIRDLPQGVDLTVFRIVQEALTNSLNHSGRTRASVRIHHGRHELRVQVVDEGSARAPEIVPAGVTVGASARSAGNGEHVVEPGPNGAGSRAMGLTGEAPEELGAAGHGLIGMRERVGLYGGDLYTGQRPGGGFEVLARLPLEHVTS